MTVDWTKFDRSVDNVSVRWDEQPQEPFDVDSIQEALDRHMDQGPVTVSVPPSHMMSMSLCHMMTSPRFLAASAPLLPPMPPEPVEIPTETLESWLESALRRRRFT